MGPGYFVIAILGCADGSTSCTPVATMPTHYASQAACAAAAPATLAENATFDFPSLLAECRSATRPATAEQGNLRELPAIALRG
ncbi:MAG: hypothetical protein M3438_00290 [Pseudomonadota bacterium]|nr:hypothetical protein [Pseudomonadota bacterium]